MVLTMFIGQSLERIIRSTGYKPEGLLEWFFAYIAARGPSVDGNTFMIEISIPACMD